MEKNFYRDQFEQMLKDTADSFRMYPSRKIWHSIYNDIHPARKWPSFAVLLLLTVSIMYIGVTNPDTSTSDQNNSNTIIFAKNENRGQSLNYNQTNFSSTSGTRNFTKSDVYANVKKAMKDNSSGAFLTALNQTPEPTLSRKQKLRTTNSGLLININNAEIFEEKTNTTEIQNENIYTDNGDFTVSKETKKIKDALTVDYNKNDELSWKEDMAFYAKRGKSKERFSYQIYATPSLGYRTLENKAVITTNSRDALIAEPDQNDYYINHTNSFNLEFGGNVLYNLNDKIRVKAGVQLNVTSYLINAFVLSHPVTSTLLLEDQNTGLLYVDPRSTMISNSQGLSNTYLNNSTFQFSVPVGADVQIMRYKKIKLMAGATIQPTYISGGNAYLLSTDMKNYINDPSMLRKFNLNGGVETFVSYQLKNGVSLNAGPQVRYQFLSTYNDQYSYSEKLYNIGVKFGITSRF